MAKAIFLVCAAALFFHCGGDRPPWLFNHAERGLNIRDKPAEDGKVLVIVHYGLVVENLTGRREGSEITQAGITDRWLKIKYKDQIGYAFAGYLSRYRRAKSFEDFIAENFRISKTHDRCHNLTLALDCAYKDFIVEYEDGARWLYKGTGTKYGIGTIQEFELKGSSMAEIYLAIREIIPERKDPGFPTHSNNYHEGIKPYGWNVSTTVEKNAGAINRIAISRSPVGTNSQYLVVLEQTGSTDFKITIRNR